MDPILRKNSQQLVCMKEAVSVAIQASSADCFESRLSKLSTTDGKNYLLSIGKAAVSMAQNACKVMKFHSGICVAPHGSEFIKKSVRLMTGSHPTPDRGSVLAARAALDMTTQMTVSDRFICLISGGGSSLFACPISNLSLDIKKLINRELLQSGADIYEINCVRQQLSCVKGGRLALSANGAEILNFAISDVVGDDPSIIASGPTVPCKTSQSDAIAVVQDFKLPSRNLVLPFLENRAFATPSKDSPVFERVKSEVLVTPRKALEAAAKSLKSAGIETTILNTSITGDSEKAAKYMGQQVKRIISVGTDSCRPPLSLVSGGETTVAIKKSDFSGLGGPNSHFLLALMIELSNCKGCWGIAVDSDGVDGNQPVAGAWFCPDTMFKAKRNGLDPKTYLSRFDSHNFFSLLDQQIILEPTNTNVNDIRIIFIESKAFVTDR